jgi:hypothetical protein
VVVSVEGTEWARYKRSREPLDARLRAIGVSTPPRHHRTRLVRTAGGQYASALIRCSDDLCTFCHPPRRLQRPLRTR